MLFWHIYLTYAHVYMYIYIYIILLFICSWCDVLPDFINLINVDVDVEYCAVTDTTRAWLRRHTATRNMISRTSDITQVRPSSHVGRLGSMAAFSEIGKSASRSVSSSKVYLRTTVAWPLCLRHNILRNEQEIFHNNVNVRGKWRLRDTG